MRQAAFFALFAAGLAAAARAQDVHVRIEPPVWVRRDAHTRVWQDAHTTHIWSYEHVREYGLLSYRDVRSTSRTVVTLHPGTTYFEYSESVPAIRCDTWVYPHGVVVTRCGPEYVPVRRIVIQR
jgi:hypothetical protein